MPSHAAFFRSPECLFSQKVLIYLRRKFYILHDTRLQLHAAAAAAARVAAEQPFQGSATPRRVVSLNSAHLHITWRRLPRLAEATTLNVAAAAKKEKTEMLSFRF